MARIRCFLLLFLPFFLFAQPDTGEVDLQYDVLQAIDLDKSTIQSNNLVTLANRLPQDIRDIPFTAYIITQEQIANRGYATLVDVLKDLPGIKVSQPGSAMHGETFLMRGLFGNYYVKILVDDLPIQPSATSGMPIGMQLTVAQADHIEVLYGPAAAIYGADAMAGVINIVTKKSEQMQMLQADVAIGLPGNWKFDATIGGKFGKNNTVWNYMFYGGIYQFDNLPIVGSKYQEDYNPANYSLSADSASYLKNPLYKGSANQPDFTFLPQQSQKFGFRMGTKKLNFGLDFGQRSTHSAIGSNPLGKLYHDPNTTFGEQVLKIFASYKTTFGKWYSQSNLQFLSYEINPASNYITINNPTSRQGQFYQYGASADIYAEQFFSRSFNDSWTVLAGVTGQFSGNLPQYDFFESPFKPADYKFFSTKTPEGDKYQGLGPYNFYSLAGIVDVNYSREKWNLVFGLRADYREFFDPVLNPRMGLVLKPNDKNRIRFTSSTAFRPPSSYLTNGGFLLVGDSVQPHPNEKLSAERLFNIDAGWLFMPSKNHQLDFSAFFHRNRNLITKTSTVISVDGVNQQFYGFVNDQNSSAQLAGLQLVDRISFSLGNVAMRSEASAQFASGTEVLPFGRGNLSRYRMQPFTTIKWLIEAEPFAHWYLSVRTQFFSDWTTRSVVLSELEDLLVAPSFYAIDLQLRYAFSQGKDMYIKIDNLTNNAFYGIGISGGAGYINNQVVFEDLFYNPQLLRFIKFGVRISIL